MKVAHVQPHRGLRSPLVGGKVPSVGLGDLTVVPSHASSAQCAPLHKCNTSHGTSSGLKASHPPCLCIRGLAWAGSRCNPKGGEEGEIDTPRQACTSWHPVPWHVNGRCKQCMLFLR